MKIYNGIANFLKPNTEDFIALQKALSFFAAIDQDLDCEETRVYCMDEVGNISKYSPEDKPVDLAFQKEIYLPNTMAHKHAKYIKSVFTDEVRVADGSMQKSVDLVKVGASWVDLTSNVQVGILFLICKETCLIKPNAKCTWFIKGLCALSILGQLTDKEIKRMSDGLYYKVYGGMKNGKMMQPLGIRHSQWENENDRELGQAIYVAIKTGIKTAE